MEFHFTQDSFPYGATARAAHDLADVIKRVRPTMRLEVEELQCIVARAHKRLDEAKSSPEIASAWCNLNAAFQTLHQMKRRNRA